MKKVLSVACALCMTTAMLTGCGSKPAGNDAQSAASSEASKETEAAAATTQEPQPPVRHRTVRQHPPPQSRLQLQQTQEPL